MFLEDKINHSFCTIIHSMVEHQLMLDGCGVAMRDLTMLRGTCYVYGMCRRDCNG